MVFPETNTLTLQDVQEPKLQRDDEILLRVEAAGICASDVHIYHGHFPVPMPVIPGHEFSGTVVEAGPAVQNVSVGDRVTADPATYCGQCRPCRAGRRELCENFQGNGNTRPGAFAPFTIVRADQVYPIDDLTFEEAAMTEPLSCAVHAVKAGRIGMGEDVLVLGGGLHGQILAQIARVSGANRVVLADPNPEKLELADKLGTPDTALVSRDSLKVISGTRFIEFDVIIDTTAKEPALEGALQYLAPAGRLILYGVPGGEVRISLSPWEIFRREAQILGIFAGAYEFDEALTLLKTHRVQVKPLISHRYPLKQFPEAFDVMLKKGFKQKIMMFPQE